MLVADPQGKPLFSGADVGDGQAVFLKYGLMANGSIWGHGAYLGPDYSAAGAASHGTGHRRGHGADAISTAARATGPYAAAAVQAETAVDLKTNRYDAATGTLH